ncbi:MAG: toprim domain-containing protein [Patescibacteria group bacterium]
MDARTAKRIPLTDFLASLGYEPAAVRGAEYWYRSPFRDEKTPSFKVDSNRNVFYDHGIGRGGTIVDFVQILYSDQDVSRALRVIATVSGGVAPAPVREFAAAEPVRKEPGTRAEKVLRLADPRLVRYLEEERGIPLAAAAPFVREVRYRNRDGRGFSAVGFPNRSGGYELRSPSFKGTLGTKDVTVVGDLAQGQVRLFEGFTDFLSAQVLWPEERGMPAIVLNSVALAERAAEELRRSGSKGVAFFDADEAGTRALAAFREVLGDGAVEDVRDRLAGSKDVNDLLLARRAERERDFRPAP